MKEACKHCGLPVPPKDPFDGFCCLGCNEVYKLIHDSGYEGYYEMQDRVGRSIDDQKSRSVGLKREAFWEAAVAVDDHYESTLFVSGMTCRGCAWLVQRIAAKEFGVRNVAVSLFSGRLEMRFTRDFDFVAFQDKLNHFAYSLSTREGIGLSLSPLIVRTLLTLVFSVNGTLLLGLKMSEVLGAELSKLLSLLSLVNLALLMFVGGAVFLKPAWDALQFRHLHRDMVPAGIITFLFIGSIGEVLPIWGGYYFSFALFLITFVFVLARVLADLLHTRLGREK